MAARLSSFSAKLRLLFMIHNKLRLSRYKQNYKYNIKSSLKSEKVTKSRKKLKEYWTNKKEPGRKMKNK